MLFTPILLLRVKCPFILIVFKLAQNPVLFGFASLCLREKLRFRRECDDLFGADGSVDRGVVHEVERRLADAQARQERAIAVVDLRFQVDAHGQTVLSTNFVYREQVSRNIAWVRMSDLLF